MDAIAKQIFSIQKIKDKTDLQSDNHSHAYYEMVYVRSGNFTYFIEDTMVSATDKSIILVDKNTIHKAILSNQNYVYFIIKFSPEFLDADFADEIKEIFKKKKILISSEEYVNFDILFSKLYHEYRDQKKHWKLLSQYYISEIITLLDRFSLEESKKRDSQLSVIEKVCQYINSCINSASYDALNLTDIAQTFFLSPCHLSKKFKKEVGMGIKEYINASRIAYAKRLMEKCNVITEVAYESGFSDSNYFATIFKRVEDMTPSQYLSLIQNTHKKDL